MVILEGAGRRLRPQPFNFRDEWSLSLPLGALRSAQAAEGGGCGGERGLWRRHNPKCDATIRGKEEKNTRRKRE